MRADHASETGALVKVYVACPSSNGARARYWENELRREGALITGTWSRDSEKWAGKDHLLTRVDQRNQADLCKRQIFAADLFWLLTPEADHQTIGAYWECGWADAHGKKIVVSGPKWNCSSFFGDVAFADPHDSLAFSYIQRVLFSTTQPMTQVENTRTA